MLSVLYLYPQICSLIFALFPKKLTSLQLCQPDFLTLCFPVGFSQWPLRDWRARGVRHLFPFSFPASFGSGCISLPTAPAHSQNYCQVPVAALSCPFRILPAIASP